MPGPGTSRLIGAAFSFASPRSWRASLLAIFHIASGSPGAELGSHPDEAAHFVTGLMVRDYLTSGFHESPLKYADSYYMHYPKIGLGIWPPFFYIVQAAWTLASGASVAAVLRLNYVLALALALMTGWRLWKEYGLPEAAAGSLLLVSLPLVQMYSNMVMAEMLSALLMFGAAVCFARYMDAEQPRGQWRAAIAFGLAAGLAIMTKGTGLALALVPVLAILLTGRYGCLNCSSVPRSGEPGCWWQSSRDRGRGIFAIRAAVAGRNRIRRCILQRWPSPITSTR